MNLRFRVPIACMGMAVASISMVFSVTPSFAQIPNPESRVVEVEAQLSESQLHEIARTIAVKIIDGEWWGSGTIVHRQGQTYTVLTNHHVLDSEFPRQFYPVQTSDGEIYQGKVVSQIDFGAQDLALVQFRSDRSYPVAAFSEPSSLNVGDEVFAGGFPERWVPNGGRASDSEFEFTIGRVEMLTQQTLSDGYQIGYTNRVDRGMSGGPLLNHRGEIVGVNGRRSSSIFANAYIFADGTMPSPEMQQEMSRYSWAIPVGQFTQIPSQVALLEEIPSPIGGERPFREPTVANGNPTVNPKQPQWLSFPW